MFGIAYAQIQFVNNRFLYSDISTIEFRYEKCFQCIQSRLSRVSSTEPSTFPKAKKQKSVFAIHRGRRSIARKKGGDLREFITILSRSLIFCLPFFHFLFSCQAPFSAFISLIFRGTRRKVETRGNFSGDD